MSLLNVPSKVLVLTLLERLQPIIELKSEGLHHLWPLFANDRGTNGHPPPAMNILLALVHVSCVITYHIIVPQK